MLGRVCSLFFRLIILLIFYFINPAFAENNSQDKEKPKVTVVLAGGGAKGFAHLAVLRRLEKDHIPIAKIIGTSMGAVIGGLYASGMTVDEIEYVLGSIDPSEVALDMVHRLELSNRARAYQQQYPIDFSFGVKDGQVSIARGLSDGQRFLALLQKLTSHIPSQVNFDTLKIPFRAVATRSDTGEIQVFKDGSLALAIRASMAAPGVFAPIEINGETYLDGGLVSNLPVEVALDEGAEIVVASFLKSTDETIPQRNTNNALTMADRMLDILIKQNERRNLKLLRSQDLLVSTSLPGIEFTDFNKYKEIIKAGEVSVTKVSAQFEILANLTQNKSNATRGDLSKDFNQSIKITSIAITGLTNYSNVGIKERFESVVGTEYDPLIVGALIEDLYVSGNFEKIYYSLDESASGGYQLHLNINEKIYGPSYYKTSVGFLSEQNGVNLFSVGVGLRRPWLNDSGLEGFVDARIGSDQELTGRLIQPIKSNLNALSYLSYKRIIRPAYSDGEKVFDIAIQDKSFGVGFGYEWSKKLAIDWYLFKSDLSASSEMASIPYYYNKQYSAMRLDFKLDQLDAQTFSTDGYYARLLVEDGLNDSGYKSARVNLKWAGSARPHSLNIGLNLGQDHIKNNCVNCTNPNLLYLGGFQSMGAFKFGQLMGDNLVHAYMTYAYQLTDTDLFRQKTYVGFVGETGDSWSAPRSYQPKRSQTVFVGIDSKLGDIYMGLAQGSQGAKNIFVQLGRHFSY